MAGGRIAGLRPHLRCENRQPGENPGEVGFVGRAVTAGLLATASKSAVRVWRTSDWTEAYSLPDHAAPVAFSPDGRRLAANFAEGVRVYNSSDGKARGRNPEQHAAVCFQSARQCDRGRHQQGNCAVGCGRGETVADARTFRGDLHGSQDAAQECLVFSPDGDSVVAARNILRDGSIFVLDVWVRATGEKVAAARHRNVVEHAGMVSSVAFAPGGQLLASASQDHSIRLWDLGSGQCVERLYGNSSEVWAVAFTADGQGFISGAKDGTVRLWPTNTAARERLYAGNWTPLKFSKDGRVLAAIDDQSSSCC